MVCAGTDTSCILAWLIDEGFEVIAFMADVGQEEDFAAAEKKAYAIGAKKFFLVVSSRSYLPSLHLDSDFFFFALLSGPTPAWGQNELRKQERSS